VCARPKKKPVRPASAVSATRRVFFPAACGGQAEILGGYLYRKRGTQMPDGTNPEAFVVEEASLGVCGISGDTRGRHVQGGETRTGNFGGGHFVARRK